MIKIDNSYFKKLDKMCFKKPMLSINDYLENRLIIYFSMYTNVMFNYDYCLDSFYC